MKINSITRRASRIAALLAATLLAPPLQAKEQKIEDPRVLADKYLLALADSHDQSGKDHLLGGLTLDAVTARTLQAEIINQGAKRSEDGALADAASELSALDKAGGQTNDSLSTLSIADARALMEKTKVQRRAFAKKLPVLADVVRTDRPLYWHPRNPMRLLLQESGTTGNYHLDYVAFTVRSRESDGKAVTWPLRIVRFKTDTNDTGWKVLPASVWDPE